MWLDHLPFFDSRHRLVGSAAGDAGGPAQLAARLLASSARPRARRFARRQRDGDAAIECAAATLREALAREAGGLAPQAEALWPEAHRAWQQLARNPAAAQALAAAARELAIEEPEATARELVQAAGTDLLPSLHAILHAGLLNAGPSTHQAYHLRALRETATRDGVAAEVVEAMVSEHVAAARAAHDAGDTKSALELYRHALERLSGDVRRAHLGNEAVAAFRAWAFGEKGPSASERREQVQAAAALAQALPASFTLARLQAALEMREGVAAINEDDHFNDGALRFARAALLDPLSAEPGKLLADTRAALEQRRVAIRSVLAAQRQLNAAGQALLLEVNGNLEAADGFADSAEGRALAARVRGAVVEQLCLRLRLDPAGETRPGAVAALVDAVSAFDPATDTLAAVRARVTARHPELAEAPWEQIGEVRAKLDGVSPAVLAEVLPAPGFELDEAVRQALVDAAAAVAEPAPGPRRRPARFDPWIFWPWLFSSQDRLAKLAAVTGALLLLFAGGSEALRRWHGGQRDAAYARFLSAQEAADAPAMMAAAAHFLAHVPRGVSDYRVEQVRAEYAPRLLAEMAGAARSGDDQHLLALQRDARLLRTDGAPAAP